MVALVAVAVVPEGRLAVLVAVADGVVLVPAAEVLPAVEVAVETGLLVAVPEAADGTAGFLSAALPGLDVRVLVRLAVVAGFLSSSLALTLGRLRWEVAVPEEVGRRDAAVVVVVVGGRVGGLLKPAAPVRVAEEAVEGVALPAGRRAAVVAVAPVALEVAAGRVVPAVLAVAGDFGEVVLGASVSAMAAVLHVGLVRLEAWVAQGQFCIRGGEKILVIRPIG